MPIAFFMERRGQILDRPKPHYAWNVKERVCWRKVTGPVKLGKVDELYGQPGPEPLDCLQMAVEFRMCQKHFHCWSTNSGSRSKTAQADCHVGPSGPLMQLIAKYCRVCSGQGWRFINIEVVYFSGAVCSQGGYTMAKQGTWHMLRGTSFMCSMSKPLDWKTSSGVHNLLSDLIPCPYSEPH